MSSTHSYSMPPQPLKADGEERCVGIELEMSGIELSMIACQINIVFGGRIEEISPFEFVIRDTELGDFKIELDYVYLKKYAKEKFEAVQRNNDAHERRAESGRGDLSEAEWLMTQLADIEVPDLESLATDVLSLVAKSVVPLEIVTPPIPVSQLHRMDTLVRRLRDHDAKGTRDLVFYAFGVHLNPELPALDVDTILRYFRAFLCLQEWLAEEENLALSRRLSPFINKFPGAYVRKVMQQSYRPTLTEFCDDYLADNASRNRVLDLLPLLAWLDEKRVKQALPEEKNSRRPTFHYRLPNSDIDNPQWGLHQAWNRWVMVERLAEHSTMLNELMWALDRHLDPFTLEMTSWKDRLKLCVKDLSLV